MLIFDDLIYRAMVTAITSDQTKVDFSLYSSSHNCCIVKYNKICFCVCRKKVPRLYEFQNGSMQHLQSPG